MASTSPRIQVTVDSELAVALDEFGGDAPRSQTVRDLAIRGAEALRAEKQSERRAVEHLLRVASGADDRYDFGVSAALYGAR